MYGDCMDKMGLGRLLRRWKIIPLQQQHFPWLCYMKASSMKHSSQTRSLDGWVAWDGVAAMVWRYYHYTLNGWKQDTPS